MAGFGDFGLMAQGANAATSDTQRLQTQQIGLEDLQRESDTNKAVREAATTGSASGQGMGGTFEDMALAAEKRGDMPKALQFRQARKALEEEGIKNVVHKALVDPRPGKRPDLAEEFNRYGKRRDMSPDDVELDEKGNLWATNPQTGQRGSINIGVAAERLGMVKPFEHILPPGSTYLRSNPVTGATTTFKAPPADKFAATRAGTIFDTATGEVKYTPPDENWTLGEIQNGDKKVPVSFNKKSGDAVIIGPGGNPEKTTVHTDSTGKTLVTIGGKVFEVAPGAPATPAKSHLFSPDEPATPGTPATLTPVNTDAPPVDGARKAPDGQWYVPDPNNKGKYLQVVMGGGTAAPAAAPKAPVAKPQPKPAAPPVTAEEDKIPEVAAAPGGGLARSGYKPSRVAAARQEQDKARAAAPGKRAVETFRAIAASPRMTAEDAPLIKEALDSGLLTPAEKSKAERMLAKLQPQAAGYARGGKVQRFGI